MKFPIVVGMQHLRQWVRRLSPLAVDVLVAVVVAVPTMMDAWWNEAGSRPADIATYGLAAVSGLVLLVRRRWPVAVAMVAGAAWSGLILLGHHGELLNLPVMVALYTIAVQGSRQAVVITAVVASCWSGLVAYFSDDPIGAAGGAPVLEMIWPLVPLALGDAVRSRRELTVHAAAEREREAQRRVDDERTRMAQEFHDVVAHTMTAVNVQMTAADAAFDSHPDTARAALQQARASSKAALEELRASLALSKRRSAVAPSPSLERLAELTVPVRAAGIHVSLNDHHQTAEISGAVSLAAYRVVQEALTNVVRHSNARHVVVTLEPTTDGLVVEITDDGDGPSRAAATPPHNGQFGLIGMADRVQAVGGQLEHGQLPGGGFRVRAVLPAMGEEP